MTKKIIYSFLCITFVFALICNNVNAVTVTKENLTTSLNNYSQKFETNTFPITDTTVTITLDSIPYIVNYDLTNKPTFTLEIPVQDGMNSIQLDEKMKGINALFLLYSTIANLNGISYEDAAFYITINQYVKNELNLQGFIKSEFNQNNNSVDSTNIMEYISKKYYDNKTISDADTINTYKLSLEKKDITPSSCKLVTTLVVNSNADFSSLNGASENPDKSVTDFFADMSNQMFKSILPNDTTDQVNNTAIDTPNEQTDTKANLDVLPQTGKEMSYSLISLYSLIILTFFGILTIIMSFIKRK